MTLSFWICEQLKRKSQLDLRLPYDAERLALDIESVTGEHIGVNTVKRLLGLIADERQPRVSTLDIVARYLGYACWEELRLIDESYSNSSFNDSDAGVLLTNSLPVSQRVAVTYPPGRSITLEHLGCSRFRVCHSENSKLREGDELTVTHLLRGYPMLAAEVVRGGQPMGSFTAGKAQGINFQLV